MKLITHIIKEIMPNVIVKLRPKQIYNPLGRWNMEICNKKINQTQKIFNEKQSPIQK